jgi:hypothetical protein
MRHLSCWRLPVGIGVLAGALVLSAPGSATPTFAQTTSAGPVSNHPATGTPELVYGSKAPHEQINVLKQCGSTIYAGGTFSKITWDGKTFTRNNLFSFSATSPFRISNWNPDVNGNVQALAFDGSGCTSIYVGGTFTQVGSTTSDLKNLAEVSTSTGQVIPGFGHYADAEVDTIVVDGSHLLTGGAFTKINNSTADPYYASLNVTSGKNDGYLDLGVSGNYQYPGVAANATRIYAQQVSHGGSRVMVEGDFMHVGGQPRQQIFQLWLSPSKGVVTGWHAPVFNAYCTTRHPFYAWEAAWATSDNEVYVATTGNHLDNWNGKYPVPPPCDYAMAFSANESSQNPAWTNSTGCNSLLSVIADGSAVYVAGHPRWFDNSDSCKGKSPNAIQDYGMAGLNPSTGAVLMSSPTTPMYTMSRANGDYMMLTSAGLWIGSTNRFGDNSCNGVSNLSGICFLPYPSS